MAQGKPRVGLIMADECCCMPSAFSRHQMPVANCVAWAEGDNTRENKAVWSARALETNDVWETTLQS